MPGSALRLPVRSSTGAGPQPFSGVGGAHRDESRAQGGIPAAAWGALDDNGRGTTGSENCMFARWGRLVYRWRWVTLAVSLALLVATAGILVEGGTLSNGNSLATEAGHAAALMNAELPHTDTNASF